MNEKDDSDLSIEELLALIDAPKRRTTKPVKETLEPPIEWMFSLSAYECIQCGRVYFGKLFHATISLPTKRYTAWCPKCLDPVTFWNHHNFTVASIKEPQIG